MQRDIAGCDAGTRVVTTAEHTRSEAIRLRRRAGRAIESQSAVQQSVTLSDTRRRATQVASNTDERVRHGPAADHVASQHRSRAESGALGRNIIRESVIGRGQSG